MENTQKKKKSHPRRVPIPKKRLLKYDKGEGINLKEDTTKIKNKIHIEKFKRKEKAIKHAIENSARAELLLTEDYGHLEADPGDSTLQYKQSEIANNVDITSATKFFTLDLNFGPYCLKYFRNGRHLVLGGKKGHVAGFDWITKKLACEMNVMESVHDVSWLHIETMFAVAQKDWVYIYDNQGIELHCLKRMNDVNKLEFLPYHFLLASGSRTSYLTWLDVSIGKLVSRFSTTCNNITVMTQNPTNALLCIGDAKGVVSMWSPNSKQPLAKMLCHKHKIEACVVHPYGTYMATSCSNRYMKVWDIRQLAGPVHNMILRHPAQHLSYSQRGLLAAAMGNVVEVYRESVNEIKPYLRHRLASSISSMQFCPYEDVLGVATAKNFTSLLVPGSAEANFDALEINPYQTKKQRREAEVKALLDKIQPELISLDPTILAEVDVPRLKEKVEAKKKLLYIKPKEIDFKPRKTKSKGKGGTAKVIKTKKILKELSRKEHIEMLKDVSEEMALKKKEVPQKSYGVLDRFVSK
ncbi:PREDICTED: WD repeat-containing protein 46 [Polistes dominula]|uniref:WD repeat-containing protein 46 n=1 Tax=Polistes dominula TaxID=743375 RepID=A0ABM1IR64_POLDO|nr:PREDICTED: WD repeat-containing protein 46 [Polistes dominula]